MASGWRVHAATRSILAWPPYLASLIRGRRSGRAGLRSDPELAAKVFFFAPSYCGVAAWTSLAGLNARFRNRSGTRNLDHADITKTVVSFSFGGWAR